MRSHDVPERARPRRRASTMLAVFAIGGLVLAACGDDDSASDEPPAAATVADDTDTDDTDADGGDTASTDDDDTGADPDDSGTTDSDDGDTSEPVDTGDTGEAVSGDPITVMTVCPIDTMFPPYPALCETATLYESWVNDQGGVAGRPLEVITCDDKGDVNEAASCARQAVDNDVVAVVAPFSWDATLAISIVEEAGIAWFGGPFAAVPGEYASEVSFPFGSLFAQPVGGVQRMLDDGCESPVFVLQDVDYGHLVQATAVEIFERFGSDPSMASFVFLSPQAQDYTAEAAQAVEGDCINAVISESQWGQWLTALQSVGLGDQRIYGPQGNLTVSVVDQFPELLEGATVVAHYPGLNDPVWDDFRNALDTYEHGDYEFNSLVGLGGWVGYTAFNEIASTIDGDITAESFLEAVSSTNELDLGGKLPVRDLSTSWDGLGGIYPRVFALHVYFDAVVDGEIVATGDEPFDMSEILQDPMS